MPSQLSSLKNKLRSRRRLRKPTGLRFAIADAPDQLNAAQWEALTQGQSWSGPLRTAAAPTSAGSANASCRAATC